MSKVKARAKVPKEASIDEVIEVKTLLRHPMHSGRMKDSEGNVIPRKIINKFIAYFNDKLILSIDLEPSISSNPYIVFPFKVKESGTFNLLWQEETGEEYTMEKTIAVS